MQMESSQYSLRENPTRRQFDRVRVRVRVRGLGLGIGLGLGLGG